MNVGYSRKQKISPFTIIYVILYDPANLFLFIFLELKNLDEINSNLFVLSLKIITLDKNIQYDKPLYFFCRFHIKYVFLNFIHAKLFFIRIFL